MKGQVSKKTCLWWFSKVYEEVIELTDGITDWDVFLIWIVALQCSCSWYILLSDMKGSQQALRHCMHPWQVISIGTRCTAVRGYFIHLFLNFSHCVFASCAFQNLQSKCVLLQTGHVCSNNKEKKKEKLQRKPTESQGNESRPNLTLGYLGFVHNYAWISFQFPKIVYLLKKVLGGSFFFPGMQPEQWSSTLWARAVRLSAVLMGPWRDSRAELWSLVQWRCEMTGSVGRTPHLWCCQWYWILLLPRNTVILLHFLLLRGATRVCSHSGSKDSSCALF